jgi:predicted NBD/HSP70 family sugar kinase
MQHDVGFAFSPYRDLITNGEKVKSEMALRIGVDLGGSWLRIGALDSNSKSIAGPHVAKYPSPRNWQDFVDLLSRHNADKVEGFGVAISGPIENHTTVIHGPNLPWLTGRNVGNDLRATLRKPVVIANDMEAATEGEMAHGVLRHYAWAIFDTISTGWGGNLVLNGMRVDGEPGHANVSFDTPHRCGAGHNGCYESLYSGSALERQIAASVPVVPDGSPAEIWEAFNKEAEAGASWALQLLDGWAEGVGRAWANVLNRIRPMQAIVYMGTTAETLLAIPRVQQRLRASIKRIAMFPEHQSPEFPMLKAQEEHRSIFGAVIVYEKECRKSDRPS